jgi:hypothetical protein
MRWMAKRRHVFSTIIHALTKRSKDACAMRTRLCQKNNQNGPKKIRTIWVFSRLLWTSVNFANFCWNFYKFFSSCTPTPAYGLPTNECLNSHAVRRQLPRNRFLHLWVLPAQSPLQPRPLSHTPPCPEIFAGDSWPDRDPRWSNPSYLGFPLVTSKTRSRFLYLSCTTKPSPRGKWDVV